MKKLFILMSVIGIASFTACDKDPKEEPKPFPIGAWQTNREYFNLTAEEISPSPLGAYFKEQREKEVSGSVAGEESYRLTFNEDGTGSGSGMHLDGSGRYDFEFSWQLFDDELTVTAIPDDILLYYTAIDLGDDVFFDRSVDLDEVVLKEVLSPQKKVIWTVEESTADNMDLSTFVTMEYRIEPPVVDFAEYTAEGDILNLTETHTYRYTFERVE